MGISSIITFFSPSLQNFGGGGGLGPPPSPSSSPGYGTAVIITHWLRPRLHVAGWIFFFKNGEICSPNTATVHSENGIFKYAFQGGEFF